MEKKELPSGAELVINLAPFEEAFELTQALAEEFKSTNVSFGDTKSLTKDVVCTAISSKKIMAAMWKCMARCTYNKFKITPEIFESEKAREDFFDVVMEVGTVNAGPFVRRLFAELSQAFLAMGQSPSPK